jgi:hypothetical protein
MCRRAAVEDPASSLQPTQPPAPRTVPNSAGAAFTLGDDRNAAPEGASYAELRKRPVNWAPETRFTVGGGVWGVGFCGAAMGG